MRLLSRHGQVAALAAGVLLGLAGCAAGTETPVVADATATATAAAPTVAPSTAPVTPKVVKREVTETRRIPYKTRRVEDSSLDEGTTRVRTRGRTGVKKLTYEVTYTGGGETDRRLVRTVVSRRPVTKVVVVGTREAPSCDSNYSGACVPIASDVDCAGGGGNGPAYVTGPVRIIGTDVYDLDRDGDGIACD